MARQRSKDKRDAIMAAATRVIAAQGLSAPTAAMAKEAGVANGSLFTYFETKADLFNALYLELKTEMADAALAGLPPSAGSREQMFHLWSHWMGWATCSPEKPRALAQLDVSDEITAESREAGHRSMAGVAELLERVLVDGPMREAPMGFVVAAMNSLAGATMSFMVNDPANADMHSVTGFEALWRMIA